MTRKALIKRINGYWLMPSKMGVLKSDWQAIKEEEKQLAIDRDWIGVNLFKEFNRIDECNTFYGIRIIEL